MKTLEQLLAEKKREAIEDSDHRTRLTGKVCGYRQDLAERIVELERYVRDGAVLHEDGYIRYPNKPSLLGYD